MELTPFVKWAGGKTQLLPEILKRVPKEFNNYYEPFIGGGTVLLALQPNNATINDINSELIHVYKTIVDEPLKLIQSIYKLDSCDCTQDYYNKQKEAKLQIKWNFTSLFLIKIVFFALIFTKCNNWIFFCRCFCRNKS